MLRRRAFVVGLGVLALPRPARAEAPLVVLGRFTTTYAKDEGHKSRAFNVELAADAVDARVVGPGATFSFNDAVGERTSAFGFARSQVIRDGMMAEGTGGGTCQVASTLYAAGLLSGLEIVARAPHTRPSAYIRMGLDATVAFPAIDLRLRNPLPVPVTIRASTRLARGELAVSIEARGGSIPDVTVTSEIVERLAFARTIRVDRSLAEGQARLVAFGIPGYRVRRVRELRAADGVSHRDVRVDLYPPTNEVVAVAPGYDEARLEQERPAIDPTAVRPVLVQLRPSTEVRLDNGGASEIRASDRP